MLTVKTVKNQLNVSEKGQYFFRSNCTQSLSVSKLAQEMAEYNSSFTEADCNGLMAVFSKIVTKYLALGYNVELPFGVLKVSATGTCSSIQDSFSVGYGDNKISFIFSISDDAKKIISENLEYRQILPESSFVPKIFSISSILNNAKESKNLNFKKGDILKIRGKNLNFDFADEKQGIFLENENESIKLERFTRAGTNVVDVIIPDSIENGEYNVRIFTKIGVRDYGEAKTTEKIIVENWFLKI